MPMEHYWFLIIVLLVIVIVFLGLKFRDKIISRLFRKEEEKLEQEEVCREFLKREICNLFFFEELKDYDQKLEELQSELVKLEKSNKVKNEVLQKTLRELIDYAVNLKIRRN